MPANLRVPPGLLPPVSLLSAASAPSAAAAQRSWSLAEQLRRAWIRPDTLALLIPGFAEVVRDDRGCGWAVYLTDPRTQAARGVRLAAGGCGLESFLFMGPRGHEGGPYVLRVFQRPRSGWALATMHRHEVRRSGVECRVQRAYPLGDAMTRCREAAG